MVKRIVFILSVLAICLMMAPFEAAANQLSNPGFESGTLDGWASWGNFQINSDVVYSGLYSAQSWAWGGTNGLWQNISASESDQVDISAYIKTDVLTGTEGYLALEFYDASDTLVGSARTAAFTENTDWMLYSLDETAPAGTAYTRALLRVDEIAADPTGSVFFDDVSADANAVPEPSSLILLGSGIIGLMGLSQRKNKK